MACRVANNFLRHFFAKYICIYEFPRMLSSVCLDSATHAVGIMRVVDFALAILIKQIARIDGKNCGLDTQALEGCKAATGAAFPHS